MVRRLSLVIIAVAIAIAPQAGLQSQLYAQSATAKAVALLTSDLAGLRLRGIGPATMSGRFVDMDVVESNPYIMYVASATGDRKSTRLNSSHGYISYAVFCLKKKKKLHNSND